MNLDDDLAARKRAYCRAYYHKYKQRPNFKRWTPTLEQRIRKAAYMRQYLAQKRAADPEYIEKKKAHDRRYRSSEAGKLTTHKSRAKRRSAGTRHKITFQEWSRTLSAFSFLCAYCRVAVPTVKDHFIPVALQGGTITGNLVPACHRCNSSKSCKHPEDWCSPEQFRRVQNTLKSL